MCFVGQGGLDVVLNIWSRTPPAQTLRLCDPRANVVLYILCSSVTLNGNTHYTGVCLGSPFVNGRLDVLFWAARDEKVDIHILRAAKAVHPFQ